MERQSRRGTACRAPAIARLFAKEFTDIPRGLAGAFFVFDHCDTHILSAIGTKSYARADGNLAFAAEGHIRAAITVLPW